MWPRAIITRKRDKGLAMRVHIWREVARMHNDRCRRGQGVLSNARRSDTKYKLDVKLDVSHFWASIIWRGIEVTREAGINVTVLKS